MIPMTTLRQETSLYVDSSKNISSGAADDNSLRLAVWVVVVFCMVGIVANSLGLYVILLSFWNKEGGVWLMVVGVCDLVQCACIIPFEAYGLMNIKTVDMMYGMCFIVLVTDSSVVSLVVYMNCTAVVSILARLYLPWFPRVRKKHLSIVMGVSIVAALATSFSTLVARPSGLVIQSAVVSPGKIPEGRSTCIFRDATFLDNRGVGVGAFLGLRLFLLILLLLAAAAALVLSVKGPKGHNDVGVDLPRGSIKAARLSKRSPRRSEEEKINVIRLMEAVDNVVVDVVHMEKEAEVKNQVKAILAQDSALITRVIDLYLSDQQITFNSADAQTFSRQAGATLPPLLDSPSPGSDTDKKQFSGIPDPKPALSPAQADSKTEAGKMSNLFQPNKKTIYAPGPDCSSPSTSHSKRPSAVSEATVMRADTPALASLDRGQPQMKGEETLPSEVSEMYFSEYIGAEADIHSALVYLSTPPKHRLNLRKELIYQRVLSYLTHIGYSVKKSPPPKRFRDSVRSRQGSLEYTVSRLRLAIHGGKIPPVELSIVTMTFVSVVLVVVSLLPLSFAYYLKVPAPIFKTATEAVRRHMWTEVYFLHSNLKPVFYFIFVAKFRMRFFFLFCRHCCKKRHARAS